MATRRDWLLAWILTLSSVGALAIFNASDPDLGFHLATGRAILAAGRLPSTNVLSFAEPNQAWVLQQGWPALLFELLWQKGGIAWVILAKALVIVGTWALVFATTKRLGASPFVGCVVTLVAALSCAFRFVERPLIFSNLALAAVGFCLSSIGSGRSLNKWPLVAAGALTAAACHVHAGAVLCFLLLFSMSADLAATDILRRFRQLPRPDAGRVAGYLALAAVGALGLAGLTLALYHPFGLRVLWVPFRMGTDSFLAAHLIEFRPPWATPFTIVAVYWGLLVTAVGMLIMGRMPGRWRVPLVVFGLLSLKHVRLVDAFAIVVAGPLAGGVMKFVPAVRAGVFLSFPLRLLAVSLALAAPLWHHQRYAFGLGYNLALWPLPLLRTIELLQLRGPAFVSDGWAGPWLAFNYPRERVYFFPALDAFSERFVREDYMDVRYGRPGWNLKLDRYGVDLVVLKHTSPGERAFQNNAPNLRHHLARDPRWSLVAFDDSGSVFVRKAGTNAIQARDFSLPGIDPDKIEIWGPVGVARHALEAAWARGARSQRIVELRRLAREPTGP